MKYFILQNKKGIIKHTTSKNVLDLFQKEGYKLIGYVWGFNCSFSWKRNTNGKYKNDK